MALQLNLTSDQTNQGIECPVAYCRIVDVHFDLLSGKVDVAVNGYATVEARAASKSPVWGGVFTGYPGAEASEANLYPMPSLDATVPGVRAALYAWLHTIPVFAGASDV